MVSNRIDGSVEFKSLHANTSMIELDLIKRGDVVLK